MNETTDELPEDPRLMQAVEEYLAQLEAGHAPNRPELLRRYPDLAVPLTRCLDGLDLVHRATAKPKQPWNSQTMRSMSACVGDVLPANPLGDFQVLREIGRGGMGIVYEAVQLSLGRRVALKVLPFAATFDAKHLQRFHNEAHAAAQLHHTNIVPVYAVGCERGVHFYAMQLIEGQSLADMIDHLRRQAGRPSADQPSVRRGLPHSHVLAPTTVVPAVPPLPPAAKNPARETAPEMSLALSTQRSTNQAEFFRTIARFMVQAAEAVEHAHQFGIVHRDIKPGNLMIDAHDRLWVTDFGLAQFHSDANLTRTGDILGTLRYMSPEQAMGQRVLLDHRTDVYSLGATLYELVTLEPIFPGQDRHELLHQITHDEPLAPRLLEPKLPVELETIILKAVSKHPAERYSSAQALAADLQRYLEDKPILAKRPSLVERTRKWSRRHPAFVVAAVLLLIFGVVGFAVSTAMIAREHSLTHHALEAEKKRAVEAEQRFRLARRSVDEMIRLAEDELAHNPQMQSLRQRLLESALTYYQEFIELRREDADAKAELAATRDHVQKILGDLAVLQGAGRHFLLKDQAVQQDLGLSVGQGEELTNLLERMSKQRQESFKNFHTMPAQERGQRFLAEVRANEEAVTAILDPAQLRRLRQIALQCQGPMAFQEADVVTTLKLTAKQKQEIRTIEMSMYFEKPGGERKAGPPSPFSWKTFEENRKTALTKIIELLDGEQVKKWRELTGEPFAAAGRLFLPPAPPSAGGFGPPPPNGFGPRPPGGKGK